MTGMHDLRRDLVPGGIDGLPPGLSADLAILDLDYTRMWQRRLGGGGTGSHDGHLALAEHAIKTVYDLTGGDGICCVISRNVRDDESGALAMLGTRVVDHIAPWTVSDEIVWSAEPPGAWQDVPGGGGDIRASPVQDFSQIWVLAKNSPAPIRAEALGSIGLPDKERDEAISSVWHVPPDPPGEYDDPVPRTVLSRLVMSYSEPGGLVLDPFANGGMTAVVCKELGRGYVCSFDSDDWLAAAKRRIQGQAGAPG